MKINLVGFLNLNKPSGLTSHDCVAKIRRLLKLKKVGHGGTLDPLATGVLPIAVGKATRLLSFLPTDKAYRARVRFGVSTTTDDLEGEIIESQDASSLTLPQIESALPPFIGTIQQVPPAYSAISVGGKRLYELARKGETVDVPVRTVSVQQIEILGWYPGEFPELELAIACGPGTYIRAIARDLGDSLGMGATLAALTRTHSCGFSLENSLTLSDLETQLKDGNFSLVSPRLALQDLDTITLTDDLVQRWRQGQKIIITSIPTLKPSLTVQVTSVNQDFLGIGNLTLTDTQCLLVPTIVF